MKIPAPVQHSGWRGGRWSAAVGARA
jgi:hypothetical protein